MDNRTLARLIWRVNAVAAVVLAALITYAFGNPQGGDPDQPHLASSAAMDIPQALAMTALPALALAGTVLFARLGRR